MSNHLAFATVTATLRDLLGGAARVVNGAEATWERPDALKDDRPRINVFLYQVTPNADWRNADLPTRRADGSLAQRPQGAFNLHHILTFCGSDKKFEPQLLLGSALSVLHAQPILSRDMIRAASQDDLAASNLADQVELVRLSPLGMNLEELSKLWSVFFQVPYKLSVAFQASVVLVEPEISTQPALPVLVRNLYPVPSHTPELHDVLPAAGPGRPITVGDAIVLRGRNLKGEVTRVRVGRTEVTPKPEDVRDDEIRLLLAVPPFATGDLQAGVLGVQVVHLRSMGTPPTLHAGKESNAAPFVLSPRITRTGATPDVTFSAPADGVRTVTVGVEPTVRATQRVVLLLNEPVAQEPRAFSALAERRVSDADPVRCKLAGLDAGLELLARVQVDGAESPLEVTDGAYSGPKVKVPTP
ncbi:MAG TPA: Pvc16 family protein [Thermoanaerobaculia bacterium]|nr:Pvc16 family protein [Thermoanaerobaculia bacterium]